jgi:hypothetical protein
MKIVTITDRELREYLSIKGYRFPTAEQGYKVVYNEDCVSYCWTPDGFGAVWYDTLRELLAEHA